MEEALYMDKKERAVAGWYKLAAGTVRRSKMRCCKCRKANKAA